MSELILLGVLALILIGPKQLPEVARTLGRFINDLKRSAEGLTDDIKKQARVDLELDVLDFKREQKAQEKSPPIPIMKVPHDYVPPTEINLQPPTTATAHTEKSKTSDSNDGENKG